MTEYEIGWLVGILEGEASFFLSPKGYPTLQISMTDEDIIAKVASLLECNYRCEFPPSWQKRGWQPQYRIRKQSRKLLLELMPYFGARRQAHIKSICDPNGI